jgi:hypothetical protein
MCARVKDVMAIPCARGASFFNELVQAFIPFNGCVRPEPEFGFSLDACNIDFHSRTREENEAVLHWMMTIKRRSQ